MSAYDARNPTLTQKQESWIRIRKYHIGIDKKVIFKTIFFFSIFNIKIVVRVYKTIRIYKLQAKCNNFIARVYTHTESVKILKQIRNAYTYRLIL